MQKILSLVSKLSVLLFFAIWAPMVKLYFYNESYFSISYLDLIFCALVVGLLAALLCALTYVLDKGKAGVVFASGLLCASVVSTFFIPVNLSSIDGRAVEFEVRDIALWVLLGVELFFFAAYYFARLRSAGFSSVVRVLVQVSLVYVSIFSIYSYVNIEKKGFLYLDFLTAQKYFPPVLSEKNILIVSLDQIQGSIFSKFIDEPSNSEIRKQFQGFVLYPDAASTYPNTNYSLASMYLGRIAKDAAESREVAIDLTASILSVADTTGYEVLTNQKTERFRHLTISPGPKSYVTPFIDPIVHGFNLAFGVDLTNLIARIDNRAFENAKSAENLQYDWKNDFDELSEYIKVVRVREGAPTFTFMHFLGTHQPFTYNADCGLKTIAQIDSEQNVEGALDGIKCSTRLLGSLFDKLKLLGVYDSTAIIVMSDHGNELNVNEFEKDAGLYSAYLFSGSSIMGVDNVKPAGSYNPLLMFKNFGSQGELTKNSLPVSLTDITPTVCSLMGACTETQGLLGGISNDRVRSFWHYVGGSDRRDTDGSDKLHDGLDKWWRVEKYSGPVSQGVVNVLSQFNPNADAPVRLGDRLTFQLNGNAPRYLRQGWSGGEPEGRWTEGAVAAVHGRITPSASERDWVLRINANGFPTKTGSPQLVKVGVNGRNIAAWEVSDAGWYEAVIPSVLIRDGAFDVVFFIEQPTAPCDVSESADCRKLGMFVRELTVTEMGAIH